MNDGAMTTEVRFSRAGRLAVITLDRPAALNALTLAMIGRIDAQLREWAADDRVATVALEGEGKAFCAGGDIRDLYERGRRPGETLARDFYRHEYRLDRRIHRYPKPFVALIDGVCMGGGVGISINGRYRVAGDRALFAMPETGIGLFPDVGGSYFLPRCPGAIGVYLGLTGARLKAADMAYCGLASHVVASARLAELRQALEGEPADDVLARFAVAPGEAPLAALRATIDRCFAGDDVQAILDALAREGGAWAKQQHTALLAMAPLSLAITHRQLRAGRALGFEDCLRMEYRLARRCMAAPDFYEGVRALLIDKDNQPRWTPARLDQVTPAMVEACFAPLGGDELVFED